MNKNIAPQLYEWKERVLPKVITRDYDLFSYFEGMINKVIAVTGFRRVGKTYLLLDFAMKLLEKYDKKDVVYYNFEDERVMPETASLTDLLPTIKEIYGSEPKYLLLDEIQIIPNWSKWVRRINETTEIKIIVTGSNSKMSSSEIPTELRGRFLEVHVSPLSFKEYLRFIGFEYSVTEIENNISALALLKHHLKNYTKSGSLPEVVLSDEFKKNEIINSYYRTIVDKDIAEHYNIRKDNLLSSLLKLMLNQRTFTLSKLYNSLKSMQISSSKNTISQYLIYIAGSYFYNYLNCFSYKIKDAAMHPRKVYCIDNGFVSTISLRNNNDEGFLFENIIFHHLKRQNPEIAYWKSQQSNYEVDFVIKERNEVKQLIQVCSDISANETLEREIRALAIASWELKCDELLLINNDIDKIAVFKWQNKEVRINYISAWKYLLN